MDTDRTDEQEETTVARREMDALVARVFENEPVPRLSPAFEARLDRRLAGEGRARPGGRLPAGGRVILALYWILATGVAASVLTSSALVRSGRVPFAWPVLATVVLTVAVLALPYAALRRTGFSFFGLLRRAVGA